MERGVEGHNQENSNSIILSITLITLLLDPSKDPNSSTSNDHNFSLPYGYSHSHNTVSRWGILVIIRHDIC